VKFAHIDAGKGQWPVEVQCDALGVSRSGYYAWKKRPEAPRLKEDATLVEEIKAAYKTGRGAYGSPRVYRELRAHGRRVGKKRVERLMRREGIAARRKRRFRRTTDSNHRHPIAPNHLDRKFSVALPNTAWVTDVTYVWTLEGWLYLAAIIDLFSRRVVGWATRETNDRGLALTALSRAMSVRKPSAGLLHHSDRGSVYASEDYGEALTKMGAVKSMSRKANCWDNAVAESFFATLKGERLDHETYATRAEATFAIDDYIERFYNTQRRHSTLGYVSPVEFEMMSMQREMTA
jgi:putative transposase